MAETCRGPASASESDETGTLADNSRLASRVPLAPSNLNVHNSSPIAARLVNRAAHRKAHARAEGGDELTAGRRQLEIAQSSYACYCGEAEKGKSMRRVIKVWVTLVIAAAMSLMAGAGSASAATTGIQPRFAAQAHAAGLSVGQADQLQQEVTSYIHEHGGTQAALNVVDFPGGSITFVVPGEKYARDLATDPHVLIASACAGTTFCAYSAAFFEGSEISVFNNCKYATMPWKTEGSYINHLPDGVVVPWFNAEYDTIYFTPPAPSENQEVNWAPVAYILSCNMT
jgi:hypothetical protein